MWEEEVVAALVDCRWRAWREALRETCCCCSWSCTYMDGEQEGERGRREERGERISGRGGEERMKVGGWESERTLASGRHIHYSD